jgi:hypothetical protein
VMMFIQIAVFRLTWPIRTFRNKVPDNQESEQLSDLLVRDGFLD